MAKYTQKQTVEALSKLLADSYILYLKTQNFHWNVTGKMFSELHLLFETQYTDLQAAVDLIAERIRALDAKAPGSFAQFSELTSIREANAQVPSAERMIRELANDQKIIVKTINAALVIAKAQDDEATTSLLSDRVTIHEKNAWMLNSLLE